MRLLLSSLFFCFSAAGVAQEYGAVTGKLTDKEAADSPLPFANVSVKESDKGTTSDFDGLYGIDHLDPGTYTLVFSYVGYKTVEITDIKVTAGEVTQVSTSLEADAAALDKVVITAAARKDTEAVLLADQKKAMEITESIGAQQLAKLGVSNLAAATTKISGVSGSEASGDIYVRGLGDRYLYTTLNGLPVPSDNIEKKNIDLALFSTGIISNVSISKTFSAVGSADQASGNINISSRELSGAQELEAELGAGINTRASVGDVAKNFKLSANAPNYTLGFYKNHLSTREALTQQSWEPETTGRPVNYRYSITGGKKFGDNFKTFITASQRVDYTYRNGAFKQFAGNNLEDEFSDVEEFEKSISTTALLSLQYQPDHRNKLQGNSFFINKLTDQVYESGRNGKGVVFEETAPHENLHQFIRDQNTTQIRLWVHQLAGEHQIGDRHTIHWAGGYNRVDADEPNRIRNELNFNEETIQLGRTGGYQQRKSEQSINDREYNAFLKDRILLIKGEGEAENAKLDLTIGTNYRNKKRSFGAQFFGLSETRSGTVSPPSLDRMDSVLNRDNTDSGLLMENEQRRDSYQAELNAVAGYLSVNYTLAKFHFNLGARYQKDVFDLHYDVGNAPGGRLGKIRKEYSHIYPALNIKYAVDEKHNLRLALSKTITLPEFKEMAPFEYVSPTGEITRGDVELEASNTYHVDLKWEFFPSRSEILSVTGFYKNISDPINRVRTRGSAPVFSYYNSGENAAIYGVELDTRIGIVKSGKDRGADLDFGLNLTRMWHQQDLKETYDDQGHLKRDFKYDNLAKIGLQGASDWILNASLNLETKNKYPFAASLSAGYASDKIEAIGAAVIQSQSEVYFNSSIVEKGFVNLHAVISKKLNDHFSLKLTAQNLLDPSIKRTQEIRNTNGNRTTETVRSYTKGMDINLSISYKL